MEMESELQMAATAKNSFNGTVVGAILALVMVVAVLYLAAQRSKMDKAVNTANHGFPPLGAGDPNTIPNVVRNSSIKVVAIVGVLAIAVGIVGALYVAFKNGDLNELTLSSYLLIGVAAAMIYVAFRAIEAALNITQEAADNFPNSVYDAVVTIQNMLTAAMALFIFYTGIAYLTYTSAVQKLTPKNARRPAKDKVQTPPPTVEGGFVNHLHLGGLQVRGLATTKAA
jgi:hypothetical protein